MKVKKINAKNAEEAQRTAEYDISGFLCGSAVKIKQIRLTR
jgi:hypothetical protein